ncbi:hypothetical protein PFICI_00925 [Pestalotiopsis fici W106-1]|uniref:Dynactin subunit 2 n=1 Tax=Pestalotiopsis fici (strain W106-1 / CGMCC3.15140) TaxID=1229662 RepID=W3XNK7_PESFW|nr:uncharacterized protein PFICI_00925 [Pestalotiopsis fici W106-1]ETS87097.1 hypothetical protein PFICI_00925 [Pestalotiopsis fici W106-1]
MALNRKYSQLPDLDTAPDIYETPDLTDDNSTAPPKTTLGPSQSDYDFDDEEDDDHPGISRSKLRIEEARNRFFPAQVDARDVNFSDRLDGKRKSYKVTSRRQRILENGTLELGDLSGDEEDDAENLERKIARLKREIEEAKEEYNKRKDSPDGAPHEDLADLSTALDELTIPTSGLRQPKSPAQNVVKEPSATSAAIDGATYTVTYAPDYEQSHTLAKTADFDRRLAQLETAIGVTAASMPGLDGDRLPGAVVPTLEHLQKQLTILSQASTSSIDTISRRVRELTKEADQLEKARKAAKAAQESLEASGVQTSEPADEQTAKINALYGTLPAIESLAPLLPPLLDRLRSLKAIHSNAATASETLDRIEKNQSEMAEDIIQWREGLDKIETAIKASDSSMNGNMEVIDGWVKGLEARLSKLS